MTAPQTPETPQLVKLLNVDSTVGDGVLMDSASTSNVIGSMPNSRINPHQQTTPPCKMEVGPEPVICANCNDNITDKYLLKALEKYWHEDCLKCSCCHCRLGEIDNIMYYKQKMILCRRDYLRLFGNTGTCSACSKAIPAFEMVMRARNNVYHLECFACQECQHRFCVGDKFYLCDNKILCSYDYEERMVFAQMAYTCNYSSLAQLKRHIQQVDDFDENIRGSAPMPMR